MEKNKIIDLYSPCDADVALIEDLKDGVFSEKMLGDGIFITPKDNNYYSPISEGTLELVFDTKHAYYVKAKNGPTILMHIGLDTVKLKGEPFNLTTAVKSNINLDSKLVEVNLKSIESNGLLTATPIVIDENDNPGWTIKWNNKTSVKRGEKIAELCYEKKVIKEKASTLEEAMDKGLDFRGTFEKVVEKVYNFVGTDANYSRYYNCVTRLRFIVKNKDIVNEKGIKEISIVKGIQWSGDEMQIIIGGEVTQVRETLDKYIKKVKETKPGEQVKFDLGATKNKASIGSRFMSLIKGVIIPSVPILIGTGILGAVMAVLQQVKLIDIVSPTGNFSDYNTLSIIVYIVMGSATTFIGIFFCYNSFKYFGMDPIYGILFGLVTTLPVLFRGVVTAMPLPPEYGGGINIAISSWSVPILKDSSGFVWMKLGMEPGSLFMAILAGWFASVIMKQLKKRVPTWGQLLLTPSILLLVVGTVATVVFFPVISLAEAALGYLIAQVNNLPWGLSIAALALCWQFLVITGAHMALTMIVYTPMFSNPVPYVTGDAAFPIFAGKILATFGQVAAAIGISITTKNKNITQVVIGAVPAGIFGVTEPMMYGVNIPKGKPFIWGCVAAGIGGLIAGPLGATFYVQGGSGILSLINAAGPKDNITSLVATIIGTLATFVIGLLLTIFFAKDRIKESDGILKTNKKILKLIANSSLSTKTKELMTNLHNEFDRENIKKIKEWEKIESKIQSLKLKVSITQAKEDEYKKNISIKFNKLNEKLKEDIISKELQKKDIDNRKEKLSIVFKKINTVKFQEKINILEQKTIELETFNKLNETFYFNLIQKTEDEAKIIIEQVREVSANDVWDKFYNMYYNSINSAIINFELKEKLPVKFNKVEKQALKSFV